MTATTVPDAQLFSMVYELTHQAKGDERRNRLRQSYPTVQLIAPYRQGVLPKREDFRPVQCQDLSTGGFSFYLAELPDFDRLVVALATSSQSIHLTAAVAHSRPAESNEGPLFLIGCRFLGRVMA
ncbi:MAG: PilZ domain-containing protein [Planctomycetes bacterium]|nr:PilZ domain-containing protein [Planctomycetota bacterium]